VSRSLRLTKFRELSLDDPFFDSLKAGYEEFPDWFAGKADEDLYVVDEEDELSGMLYLKQEEGPVEDVVPALPARKWLKIGTLKIVSRGTRLGERVIKKIFDTALSTDAEAIYVTVFEIHEDLMALFERYGFRRVGTKTTRNGVERVLVRSLTELSGDSIADYPFIHTAGHRAWLLAIYPEYHTRLLPDSILNNEPREIVQDVSHTNTIHKVYIAGLALSRMTRGDIVVFYRTSDGQGPAYYRSVVTSVCVVEEVRSRRDFADIDDFLRFTMPRSVFTEDELRDRYTTMNRLYVAKMTYNAAFGRRTTRGRLLDDGVVAEQPRWDLRELSQDQLRRIIAMGDVNARIIVD
jgi:predicted GNAT family N-acyltransferase